MSRGIIIHAGGSTYLTNAYVASRQLRELGCKLPIQWWIRDQAERLHYTNLAAAAAGATLRDFSMEVPLTLPPFARKPFSIAHSDLDEVLLLDADIVAVRDPSYLFDCPEYQEHGSLFWPDFRGPDETDPIWKCCFLTPKWRDHRFHFGFQGGQQMIDKRRCKAAMRQTLRMNLEHEIWYQLTFGEQDLYRMAWLMTETPFNVVRKPAGHLRDTILEHDPEGNLLFQHRCGAKWKLSALENRRIPGFLFEEECFGYLSELRGFARDCCPQ